MRNLGLAKIKTFFNSFLTLNTKVLRVKKDNFRTKLEIFFLFQLLYFFRLRFLLDSVTHPVLSTIHGKTIVGGPYGPIQSNLGIWDSTLNYTTLSFQVC
jgi:hypothetical protein